MRESHAGWFVSTQFRAGLLLLVNVQEVARWL